jgi:hypothetical protein
VKHIRNNPNLRNYFVCVCAGWQRLHILFIKLLKYNWNKKKKYSNKNKTQFIPLHETKDIALAISVLHNSMASLKNI